MFNFVVGAILALILIGLPLGIIGLFIASILDRRNAPPNRSITTLPKAAASASEVNHGGGTRRAIVYGRYPPVPTASRERFRLTRTAELQRR